jgi:CheY-like chemotaxis protein/HPt (histidine-containing phosphotransfer) domain-containing protein
VEEPGSQQAQRRLTHMVSGRRFAPTADEAQAEGTLVLVVDDHPTNRLVLSRQVNALGYGVVTAEDGVEALELWRSRKVALILTDCNMPRLDGYQLAQAVRAEEMARGSPRTPMLGCTANAMTGEAARCAAAGMDDCLVKPVDLLELMQRMDQWLPLPLEPVAAEPAESTEPADDVFDPGTLAVITGGDAAMEREILCNFVQADEADVQALVAAVEGERLEEACSLAHRIAGAAQTLRAEPFLDACRTLEQHARAGDTAQAKQQVRQLQSQAQRLHDRLLQRVAAHSP